MALTRRVSDYYVECTPTTMPAHVVDAGAPPLPPLPARPSMQARPYQFPWPFVISFIVSTLLLMVVMRGLGR